MTKFFYVFGKARYKTFSSISEALKPTDSMLKFIKFLSDFLISLLYGYIMSFKYTDISNFQATA